MEACTDTSTSPSTTAITTTTKTDTNNRWWPHFLSCLQELYDRSGQMSTTTHPGCHDARRDSSSSSIDVGGEEHRLPPLHEPRKHPSLQQHTSCTLHY
ncbi:hypothetical protein E2C01_074995 [Portunus trituberculatus]|uniref:Uncharacterized protein n=1 Tax=Portunus trituberculatus TaxID=210409 RepID=A0A5B7IEM6_PORTR|nr:hypothetical protein [Portunus trituberculatus]